jgi:hypothetical protein
MLYCSSVQEKQSFCKVTSLMIGFNDLQNIWLPDVPADPYGGIILHKALMERH